MTPDPEQRQGSDEMEGLPELTVKFLDPGNFLAALDGWSVAIKFSDGSENDGVLVDLRHDRSELGAQLFALTEVLDPNKEVVRTFIGNVVEVTVL